METIDYTIDRQHITKISEPGITVASVGFGNMPIPTASSSSTTTATRDMEVGHNPDGTLDYVRIVGVRETKFGWEPVEPEAPRSVIKTITRTSIASLLPGSIPPAPIVQTFNYQSGTNARTFLRSVEIDGKEIQSVEAHRNSGCGTDLCETEEKNNLVTSKNNYDAKSGLVRTVVGTGGNDAVSAGASLSAAYWQPDDPKHKRGLMRALTEGSLETKYDYPSATKIKVTDPRGFDTTIDVNDWDMTKIVTRGGDVPVEESYGHNDRGEVVMHRDTFDAVVQELGDIDPNRDDLEEVIVADPLMQRELSWQTEMMEVARQVRIRGSAEVELLREKARHDVIKPFAVTHGMDRA